MREPVLFPDAVAAVTTWLADNLGLPTCETVPNPRPDVFYRVQRVGGAARDVVVDDATIVVEAWSVSPEEAMDLAQLARAYLHALVNTYVDDTLVYRVSDVAGPASLPDPLSNQARVTATFQVTVRGAALATVS